MPKDSGKPEWVEFERGRCTERALLDCLARGDVAVLDGAEPGMAADGALGPGFVEVPGQAAIAPGAPYRGALWASFISPAVEGAWLAEPPAIVAISVSASAVRPVEWVFVSARSLWAELTRRFIPAEFEAFLQDDAIVSRVDGGEVRHPGYRVSDTRAGRRVSCRFSGRLDRDARPHPMSQPAFDFCRGYVLDGRNQLSLSLNPGQTAVIANALVCSGPRAGQQPGQALTAWMSHPAHEELGGFLQESVQ